MGTGKINILYIADSNSIHDIKWMTYFTKFKLSNGFLLIRDFHKKKYEGKNPTLDEITFIGSLPDYSLVRLLRTISAAIYIKRILKKHKIDVIHILYAEPNALWSTFRTYLAVPIIITCRGTDVLKTIPKTFEKRTLINLIVAPAYKLAFYMADWVTATSKTQIAAIKKFSNKNKNLSIIRTGVDIDLLTADTSGCFPLKNDKPYILFPRNIRPLYNHEFCLEAISLLSAQIKSDFKMVFIGKNNGDLDYQKKLEAQMKSISGVDFEFIGQQSQQEMFELYKRTSLVIMTPKSDGSPVSAMEALLCGTKVILGSLNYDKEVFSENVIHLKTWSPAELSDKIKFVLSSSLEKRELSPNTKKLMDRTHNMNKLKEIYIAVINGIKE